VDRKDTYKAHTDLPSLLRNGMFRKKGPFQGSNGVFRRTGGILWDPTKTALFKATTFFLQDRNLNWALVHGK
jgi:hypothetical protein